MADIFDIHNFLKYNINVGGTGTITLGSVVAGFQGFSNANDGFHYPYSIGDLATHWETGYGTIHMPGATFDRNFITESSAGGAAINVNAGTDQFWCAANSYTELGWNNGTNYGCLPGGRLTLTSGTPVTTADVTGATTIYYTPYLTSAISMFDGKVWYTTQFSNTSLALGTLTSGLPYDVFGFFSVGVLALELLAWTNTTTRATSITIQDGRYCKSTDKTRLYLGTFHTTATTTTEDSYANRLVFNQYNRTLRAAFKLGTTAHTYNSNVKRPWNNTQTDTQIRWINGLDQTVLVLGFGRHGTSANGTCNVNAVVNLNVNGTSISTNPIAQVFEASSATSFQNAVPANVPYFASGLGLNTVYCEEWDANNGAQNLPTFSEAASSASLFI